MLAACLEAAIAAGHRRAGDISGGLEDGFGLVDLNIVAGKRQSAADAYILPIAADPNLELVTDAVVHRLRIVHGRCVGVDYMVRGTQISASCTREVILSAGAIGSPKLLMLSGVGPAAHLRELGIDVALDLPGVGANFHDHPVANLIYCAARPVPPAQHNHGEILGLVRSDPSLAAPDLQIIFIDTPRRMPGVVAPDHGYSIGVSVMTPASRGTVRLASARPDAAPLLDPNFLGDDRDLAALVAGLELGRAIGRAAPLDAWRAAELAPGAQLADAAGLRGYVRRTVGSYFHPVGTCAIGDGELGVVDSALRVRGLAGLRVADGSVMPSIPSANTSATVYAIGERAAELIAET